MLTISYMSCVMRHVSHVMCHVSHVTCRMSHVTCKKKIGGASRWRVCYQRDLLRLVFDVKQIFLNRLIQTIDEIVSGRDCYQRGFPVQLILYLVFLPGGSSSCQGRKAEVRFEGIWNYILQLVFLLYEIQESIMKQYLYSTKKK